ncbi:ABC transporter substrate-binding protein [Arthrobacter sp. AK01]|uniref:ABC transporter substrate-binding protein n=1 Tax=Micrococcaceae TaxID=1268 RepID=UPI001E5C400F|nr:MULTISPECIES: ABC transporter substrate-binding protein [Micrococcaceae]MCD4852029.1 ABC transporter substrate-binding protein [Arthrobacter sp. AK01]MCP1413752.1 NitT/TauT family transport system substrate-binding protein [Paenarthrobacter sp. A20]
MKFSGMARIAATAAVVAFFTTSCANSAGDSPSQDKPQTVSVLMNWFAQAEQGGYWDTMTNQYGKDAGVTLDVKQGGPGIQTIPQVAAGQADFGVANADEVLLARKNGLPIVAVAAAYDTNLQCMMSHQSQGINGFKDIDGHQVSRVPSPYFDYIKSHFDLQKIQDINYTGSLADFKRNENLVQQCFVTSDVFNAKQEGIDVNILSVAKDAGYNPYGLLLFTTDKVVKEQPEVVRRVVSASIEGWKNFVKNPADAKSSIMKSNKDTDEATFDGSARIIQQGDYLGSQIGKMTEERWSTLRDQLASIGQLPSDFDVTKSFTNDFLPN